MDWQRRKHRVCGLKIAVRRFDVHKFVALRGLASITPNTGKKSRIGLCLKVDRTSDFSLTSVSQNLVADGSCRSKSVRLKPDVHIMQLSKLRIGTQSGDAIGLVSGNTVQPLATDGQFQSLSDLLSAHDVQKAVASLSPRGSKLPLDSVTLLAPIDQQEVWAAGVTYRRSK